MWIKTTVANAICCVAVLLGLTNAEAQVNLPAPGKNPDGLVAILESDAPVFDKAKACQQLAIVGEEAQVPTLANLLASPELADYARTALENIESPKALHALETATQDLSGDQLTGVIHSIGKRRSNHSIPTLTALLENNNADVCDAAMKALGMIGSSESADALLQRTNAPSVENVDSLANATLIAAQRLTDDGRTEESNRICRELLKLDLLTDTKDRVLLQQVSAADNIKLVWDAFDSDSDAEFAIALTAARRTGVHTALAKKLSLDLRKMDPKRQVATLQLLTDWNASEALPGILDAAMNGNNQLRVAALRTIAEIGNESCVPVVLDSLKKGDTELLSAAAEAAIGLKSPKIDEAAESLLNETDPDRLVAALKLIAARKLTDSFPAVVPLLKNSSSDVAEQAIVSIGQITGPKQLPLLIKLVLKNKNSNASQLWAKTLKFACLRLPRADCVNELKKALGESQADARVMLLDQIAFVGGPEALNVVVEAGRSRDDQLQDAASRLLGEWLTPDAAPEIYELINDYPRGKYRTRLLRGYIRIARQLDMPLDDRMEVCENALKLADRKEEKILVLAALKRHPALPGRRLAESLVSDTALRARALSTISEIDKSIGAQDLSEDGFVSLFDGKTLAGWKEHTEGFWRVKDGAIVGGTLDEMVKQNEFLRSKEKFSDFELRLEFKLIGDKTNAGVQIRTAEIAGDHEVSGYQADLGDGWWGCLYDESRRRTTLAGPPKDKRAAPVKLQQWNDYRILCEGNRIRLWINNIPTVDFTEEDESIPQEGIIALQVHGNMKMEAHYRNIRLKKITK